MSLEFFIVGGLIFGVYVYFTLWNIFYNSKKQRKENYPTVSRVSDEVDMDGIGNQGRFPTMRNTKKKFRKNLIV